MAAKQSMAGAALRPRIASSLALLATSSQALLAMTKPRALAVYGATALIKVFCFFSSEKKTFFLKTFAYRHPGASGFTPQPPAVALTFSCGAGFGTTVPSWVLPCEVHSQ